ncbi:hypothetical protein ACFQ48_13360 [Hymenobacter caeli]|uniref:Bacterial surface antigen (D15) domain-containing protein n=1 Tax=Hymenobacter caeli TaxID=2735894 RepID=A0ABX2FT79_9BACT|nr:hypothetical protein [Hymenobacter caeli]NRT20395.1 hypothetical protein [Hymenobacter caeli]
MRFSYFWACLLLSAGLSAPHRAHGQAAPLVRDVGLVLDTTRYAAPQQQLTVAGEPRLYFYYHADDQAAEVHATPAGPVRRLRLLPSPDFKVLDSLVRGADGSYRATVRFRNLTATPFVRLVFGATPDSAGRPERQQAVSLLPLTRSSLGLRVANPELFVGEEKIVDLNTDNPANVRLTNTWTRGQDIDYKVTLEGTGLRLHLLPNEPGPHTLVLSLVAERPRLGPDGKLTYQYPPLRQDFTVKASRLRFLSVDHKDIAFDEAGRVQGTELILDDGHSFDLHHTYRLEAQQDPGGALVAELYTRSYLTNDRVLCQLRVFNPHRQTEGYLYIKDGDAARYVTNFDIAPRPHVAVVSVLHRGGDWSQNLAVSPGETVDVRLEGESLLKGRFRVEDLLPVASDSSVRSNNSLIYRVQVPLGVVRRRLAILEGTAPTGFVLAVKEVQRPHPLNFVSVSYGEGAVPVTRLSGPVLYQHAIRDVVFAFNTGGIDGAQALYGKQCLTVDVRVLDAKNNLLDQKTIDNLVVCPGEPSPRAAYYQDKQCQSGPLSLNALLDHKTYDLGDWSRIIVTLKHNAGQYGEPGYSQVIDLVLSRRSTFDIDVSFPAGLLTRQEGVSGYGSFSGISIATLAQFSFYSPGRINHLRPYKIGAGFVALNAFNLAQNAADRDLGVVVLGSVTPLHTGRLTFPLYLGGGRLLSAGKWFYLLGPGIGVSL